MKKTLLTAIISTTLVLGSIATATNLNPGDLVITTVNADSAFSTAGCPNASSTNNLFAFVNRVDLSSGTVVYFTDNAWSGSVWTSSEGTIVFTATNLIPAGTTNYYNDCSPGSFPTMWSRVGGFDPANAGDNIIAYQGTGISPASPNFIYAIGWSSANPWIVSGSPTSNNSYIPTGLVSGTTAIIPTNLRNAQYMCANVDLGSPAFLSALSLSGNWTSSSATGFLAAPCTYLMPFDLLLTKSQTNTGGLSTGLVRVGQLIAYQLTLRSVFGVATNVKAQDVLPLGFTYVSHSASTGSYATGSGLRNVVNIASGATETLTITGTINATGTILNLASLYAFSGTDQSGANNTGTVSLTGVLTPPTAVNDSGTIVEDGSGVIAVLDNDMPGSGLQILSITGLALPTHGTAAIVGTGIFYIPSSDYCGTDTFSYNTINQFGEVSGVAATVTITITCVNDLPGITLVGVDPVQILSNIIYTDSGATASDVEDGDITMDIVVSGIVNTGVVGSYILTYNVVDSQSGAATQVTRTVHVVSGSLPTITLLGSGIYTQPALVPYTESGAQYSDLEDGTGAVSNISGFVLTNTLGTYLVTYNYTDAQGNIAPQVTRTVTITAPVCEPGRESTITTGNVASCILCAAGSANATTGGSCTQCAPNTYASAAGSQTCVACPAGLSSSTGAVQCTDTTPPIVTLQGSGTVVVLLNTIFTDPGALWNDVIDGSGSATVSGSVNTSVTGSYILTYTHIDAAGNTGNTVARTVVVTEGNMPVITLNDSPVITLEVYSSYTESGAVYSDLEDGTGMVVNISGNVQTGAVGTYTITYDYTDAQGNVAVQVSRIVHVVDTTKPVISLVGSGDVTLLIYTPYADSGATAIDNYDGNLTANIVTSGVVNTGVVGAYTITYDVTDAHGNVATQVTRTVHVIAGGTPTITLLGSGTITQEAFTPYIEYGAVYSDLEDGTGAVSSISGVVLTGVLGTYIITYDYTDMQGNPAIQAVRTIHVVAPTCAAGRELVLSGSVPSCVPCPIGSANASTGGSCVQCAPNTFTDMTSSLSCTPCPTGMTSATGAMSCSDTISPVVTLSGLSSISLLQGTPYAEQGAFWTDGVDGSGVILSPFSGAVNTSVAGTYTLLYRYIDNAGNTGNMVTRTVIISASSVEPTTGAAGFGGGGGGSSAATIAAAIAGATKPAANIPSVPTNGPSDTETFNPTIALLCYQRDDSIQLTGRSILAVHKDFPAALRFLASYELTKYTAIDTYRPFDSLTREEASKLFTQYARHVLCRQPNTDTINYSDIASADQTLVPYITLAYQLTLMHGDAVGTFRPLDTISKPEFLAVLVRMMLYNYLDETSPQWYASYEQVGKDLAIITQDIDPLAKGISRHDAALMLFRAYRYQQYGVFDKGYDTYILKNYEGVVQKYQ